MRSYSSSMSPERNPLLPSCEFLDKIILMLLMSWWDSRWGKRYQGQFILQNRNGPSLLLCQPIDIRSLVLLLALPILLWSSIFGPYRSVDVIRILKSPNCLLDSFLKCRLLSRCQLLLCLRPRLCLFLYLWCSASILASSLLPGHYCIRHSGPLTACPLPLRRATQDSNYLRKML